MGPLRGAQTATRASKQSGMLQYRKSSDDRGSITGDDARTVPVQRARLVAGHRGGMAQDARPAPPWHCTLLRHHATARFHGKDNVQRVHPPRDPPLGLAMAPACGMAWACRAGLGDTNSGRVLTAAHEPTGPGRALRRLRLRLRADRLRISAHRPDLAACWRTYRLFSGPGVFPTVVPRPLGKCDGLPVKLSGRPRGYRCLRTFAARSVLARPKFLIADRTEVRRTFVQTVSILQTHA